MVTLKFQGWFQCRLATDPDPTDEPRGISGYMKCLPGEPDFDRIIRLHNPIVVRSYTPTIGVFVTKVLNSNDERIDSQLLGARFNFENYPKYFGFNGVVADAGSEPIVPIVVSISNDKFRIQRGLLDENPKFPFAEYQPSNGIIMGGNDIAENTKIYDIGLFLNDRLDKLKKDLKNASDEIEKVCLTQRINFLQTPSSRQFFNARMNWGFFYNARDPRPYKGGMIGKISQHNTEGIIKIADASAWDINFWMGGWDPDGLCGYINGILKLPTAILV